MKRIVIGIMAVLFATAMYGENIDQHRAKQVAHGFAAQRDRNAAQLQTDIVYSHPMPNKRDAAFYIVNLGETGFVIVAANDVAHPVIGYSFDRPWPTEGDIPPQITDYLDDLAGQIEAASSKEPDRATKAEWQELLSINPNNPPQPKGNRTEVGPLLTTTWDQGQYYNAMCPEDVNGPDGHALTGCVATAMAQIIKYHQYPASGRGIHSYQSSYGELSVNYAESNYDYANMPDALTNESSDAQVNSVAKLVSDCGIAVNMGYSSGESSAYDQEARAALINFFKYSPDASFAERALFTANEWNTMMQTELNANRPVYYSGRGTGGHAFVCDGYNSEGFYHFNFGWSGSGNTWYLLDAVNPQGMSFNSEQAAILGITPDPNGNVILGQMQGTSTFTVDEPLEFYHLMGHNQYEGNNYTNPCSNIVTFVSADDNQMVADIVKFENQTLLINDGNGTQLRYLTVGENNDLSPVVSTENVITLNYTGNLFFSGFKVFISRDEGCRMVSNVTFLVEATTVHLSWNENGNATQWNIEYGLKGFELGSGTPLIANDTTITIEGLTLYGEYDFYIRPQCGVSWYGPITVMVLPPYWIDVVTTQPAGYSVDAEGNVTISSVEGLAWWAKLADNQYRHWRWMVYQEPFVPTIEGLDETKLGNGWYYACPTTITTDIDLDGYRWKPVTFYADIDGQMHTISNMYIYEDTSLEPEPYYGFLRGFSGPSQIGYTIKDMVFQNPVINCPTGYYGVLAGGVSEARIRNVGVNNAVINQYSSSPFISIYNVYGVAGGGLIGHAELTSIDNCYSTGSIVSIYPYQNINNGGIVGYADNLSSINNCYSSVQIQSQAGGVGSICAFANGLEMKNCYGIDDYPILDHNDLSNGGILDTLRFDKNTQQLNGSVLFDDISCNTLLEALNMRVVYENSESWMTWIADDNVNNDSFPVFSEPFIVTCPNAENIVAQNVIINSNNALLLQWDDSDGVSQWRIKCVEKDAPDNTAHYYLTDCNSITITDLTLANLYRIYVKPICDDTNQGGWGTGIQHVYDKPYWTDFVTTQPDGYVIDDEGNVTIQSRDGFVWLSCLVNGLHGQEAQNFQNKSVKLMVDVDLSDYRWMPIGNTWWNTFDGSFDGNNHTISNLYVNEYHDWVGLFGHVYQGKFVNITIDNSIVKGFSNVGTICGLYQNVGYDWNYGDVLFDNCHLKNASVYGDNLVGGIGGRIENWGDETGLTIVVRNCFSSGEVHGSNHVGGLIGNIKDFANISNCYSTCDIFATEMDAGGLVGFTKNCVLENSYATGIITSTGGSYAKLVGYLCENITCHYMYGHEDENPINLFGYVGENCTIDNSEWFTSAGVLENSVTIGIAYYSDLLSALNAWVDANDTNGEYLHWVADTANQNGGFPMLEQLPSTTTQSQTLSQGWNWWSTYIVQEGTNGMIQLKSTLGENGIQIKSQTASTQYLPNGSWFGTLTTLENEKSYRVNVSGGVTTELSGTPVDPTEHPITLQPNWTWIGYPVNSTQSVTSAMSGFTPQTGDVIKSQGSSSFYTGAGWFPAMNMVPGQGYLYKSSATENRTLTFTQGRGEVQNKDEYQRHWDNDIHAFADNMTVLAVVRENGEELVGNGYELGAFVNGESRGSVRLEYCEPLDRYVAVLTVSGEDVDRITFGLFDRATEKESYDSPNAITFSSNAVLGELNKPYEIGFGSEGTTGLSLFPNPVGKNEEVRLELPSDVKVVEAVVTDMLGRVIRHETIQANRIAGMSESGVYNVQVVTDKGIYHGKLIVK